MTLKSLVSAGALALGLVLAAVPSGANPASQVGDWKSLKLDQPTIVQKTLWHRGCHWGIGGYHKYVAGVGRVQCTTHKCWTNRFGIRRCRWF